jgi:O-antigen ligase
LTAGLLALAIALLPMTWATLLVVGGVAVVLTLLWPQVGVLLIVLAVPFGSLRQISLGVMDIGATEVLIALVLAAWLMRRIARRDLLLRLPTLTLPMLIFLGAILLSLPGAWSLEHGAKEVVKWLEVLVLYIMVANEMDERWTKALVAVLLGTGAAVALHGIYQFLFQVGPEGFVLFDRFMRAHGTFEQPNPYAGYLGLTLPLAVGLVIASLIPVSERVRGWWLVWAAGCGALMLLALIMSWSRGGWLGFGAAIAAIAIAVVVRSGKAAVLGTVFAVLLVYLLLAGGLARIPPSIAQRFSDFIPYLGVTEVRGVEVTDANYAVLERVAHWQAAWEMWRDSPWLGVGIGNYEPAYAAYALPMWPVALGHAHNYYLNIAAEAGVLGLAAYLLLWGAARDVPAIGHPAGTASNTGHDPAYR